jgi:3-oxoacyl-[acyl-carrier-protein] synthase-3
MPHSRFESIGAYVPSTVVSTQELVAQMTNPPPFDLEEITGIRNRRVHGEGEDSFVLALEAAEDCLARSRYTPETLDVVISASITRFKDGEDFYFEPSFAAMLCRTLGATSAIHFDVSNACAGMMTGVEILDRMIRAGVVRNGMVVSGERITAISDTAVREIEEPYDPQFGSMTVGDSAAAVILDESTDPEDRIHYVEMMTCSEYSHLCIGMPSDKTGGIALYTDNHQMHKEERLRLWPSFQGDFLAKRGSTFAEEGFDYVVHHQVGAKFVAKVQRAGEAAFETTMPPSIDVLDEYGNTSTTSHFLALYEHLRHGDAQQGAKYLLVPAASGVVAGFLSATLSLEV